jgi:PilZ domain
MAPPSTRRWTRHQVKLPVRIIAPNETSEITVPGLTTEISQGGMALYGGVPLQPGDVMAVEFETSNRLRVAALVRDRYGYCFGLEFLGLLPSEATEIRGSDVSQIAGEPDRMMQANQFAVATKMDSAGLSAQTVYGEDEILALFLKKHEAYLRQKDLELKRLRYEIQEIRQSRKEIETLLLRQVLGRSG